MFPIHLRRAVQTNGFVPTTRAISTARVLHWHPRYDEGRWTHPCDRRSQARRAWAPSCATSAGAGHGVVTAFSDTRLTVLREIVDEDSPVEVLPFAEAVGRFLAMCGEKALAHRPTGHHGAAVAQACRALPDESPFKGTALRFRGLHRALSAHLERAAEWGSTRRRWSAWTPRHARLAAKLASLAEIEREAARACWGCSAGRSRGRPRDLPGLDSGAGCGVFRPLARGRGERGVADVRAVVLHSGPPNTAPRSSSLLDRHAADAGVLKARGA